MMRRSCPRSPWARFQRKHFREKRLFARRVVRWLRAVANHYWTEDTEFAEKLINQASNIAKGLEL